MVSQTGCLGLSLRTTALAAGVITLLEAIVWTVLAAWSNLAYACLLPVPEDADLSLRLAYIIYYFNPGCTDTAKLTPGGQTEELKVSDGDPSTAQRTHLLSIVYLADSVLWIVASLLFLVAVCGCASSRRAGARLCYPWIIVTSFTMVLDLVATGFYAADVAHFVDLQAVNEALQVVTIPEAWFDKDAAGADIVLKGAPLLLLAVAVRGVILWLLNGVLLVHVVRSVKVMSAPPRTGRFQDNPAKRPASPELQPARVTPERAAVLEPELPSPPPTTSPVGMQTPPTPHATLTTEHGHELVGAVPLPGMEAMAHARGGSVSPPPQRDHRQPVRAGSQTQLTPARGGSISPPPLRDPRQPVRAGSQSPPSLQNPRQLDRGVSQMSQTPLQNPRQLDRGVSQTSQTPLQSPRQLDRGVSQTSQTPLQNPRQLDRGVSQTSQTPLQSPRQLDRGVSQTSQTPLQNHRQLDRAVSQTSQTPLTPVARTPILAHSGSVSPPLRDPRRPVRAASQSVLQGAPKAPAASRAERGYDRDDGRAATKDEIVERLERMSKIRSSGRKHEMNPELAAEAMVVHLRRHGSNASSVAAETGYPREDPRRLDLSPTRKYHGDGIFPGDDAIGRQYRDPPRHLPRMNSAEFPVHSRQAREQDDDRPRRRVDRAQSHRVMGSEWTGQYPPGNAYARQGGVRPNDLQELKKDLPWSYLTGKPAT